MLLLWFVLDMQLKRLHNGASARDPLPHEREGKISPKEAVLAYSLAIFPRPWKRSGLFKEVTRREEDQRQAKLGRPFQCKQHPSFASPLWFQSALHRAGRGKETRVDHQPSSLPRSLFL